MQHPLSDTTQPEGRQFRRHVIRGEAKIEPLNEKSPLGQIQDVTLLDISRTGVKLQINQSLELDSTWRRRIIMKDQAVGTVPVLIRYCQSVKDGVYEVGGQIMIEPYILTILDVPQPELTQDDQVFFCGPETASANPLAE